MGRYKAPDTLVKVTYFTLFYFKVLYGTFIRYEYVPEYEYIPKVNTYVLKQVIDMTTR